MYTIRQAQYKALWKTSTGRDFSGVEDPALGEREVLLSPYPCLSLARLWYSQRQSISKAGIPLVVLPPAWNDLMFIWTTLAGPSLRGAKTDTMATAWLLGMPDQASPFSGDWVFDPTSEGEKPSSNLLRTRHCHQLPLRAQGSHRSIRPIDRSVSMSAVTVTTGARLLRGERESQSKLP